MLIHSSKMGRPSKWDIQDCKDLALTKGGECLDTEYKNNKHKMQWKCSDGHLFKLNFGLVKDVGYWCKECSIMKRRTGIEEYQKVASERGGKCLTTECKSIRKKVLWECIKGHQWNATFSHVKHSKSWCPECVGKHVNTLQDCQKRASDLGGECLSETYVVGKKTRWRCKEGHEWESKFTRCSVQWCPYCSGRHNNNIEVCQEYAKSKGGKCLTTKYINSQDKMKWECNDGHQWKTGFGGMKCTGSWCMICSSVKTTIEMCQVLAESRGGNFLSTKYEVEKHMEWSCSKGHKFMSRYSNIKSGRWCRECYEDRVFHTIEECKEFAISKNGKCLSTEYKNSNDYGLIWECEEGHQWNASFSNVKNNNTWCPKCSGFRSEEKAREILEEETLFKWDKIRPKWLKGLELDGYCKELNMAFEYQGIQHYEFSPFFHRNGVEDFEKQQERDKRKLKLSTEKGVRIIFIPYKYDYTKPEEMRQYLNNQLKSN